MRTTTSVLVLFGALVAGLVLASDSAPAAPPAAANSSFPGKQSDYRSYQRYDFVVDGCQTIVVTPKQLAAGKPWIWRAEFFDAFPQVDLALLARAKVPLFLLCGDADDVVPYPENGAIVKERYEKLGGPVRVLIKKGLGHHPHGLDDPTPVVEFILKHTAMIVAGPTNADKPIRNYTAWKDTLGRPISCHDGGITRVGDTFHWYRHVFARNDKALVCADLSAPEKNVPDDRAAREALWQRLEKHFRPPAEYAGKFGPYRSPLKFADGTLAKTPEDWARRRQEILATWHRRLGAWPPLVDRPTVKRLESVQRDGYTQHHVHVQISPEGKVADGYLLVPAGPGPFPAVLVPFYEPLTSIGQGPKGQGTHDYGLQLARRQFVTLSIGTPGTVEKIGVETRQLLVEAGVQQRRQPLTLLAYAAANCHTALAQIPEVDPSRIGIIGLSYGGKWSMFASCLYDKFACAVWSDPGIVFNEQDPNVNYWEPWYLGYDPSRQRKPGIPAAANPRTGLYKEMIEAGEDLVDLHALMAPRPVLVSGGVQDPPSNWQALNHLVAVNDLLGHKHRVAMTSRPTHVPTAAAMELEMAFLEYWLKAQ